MSCPQPSVLTGLHSALFIGYDAQAAACPKGSVERMEQVVAFSVSSYSSCHRPMRSLNPLLSETFEFIYPEKGIRIISEHVSACHPAP